ncbi:hypothetical protein [Streptomyces anulatus]|uniref:hypothetical protein n=1 Tax=Streptomyces anulatus TaxID=1892 RepID=UPI00386CB7F7|nr:hypothetical protein OG238_40890 [Streptomyces anulatus]
MSPSMFLLLVLVAALALVEPARLVDRPRELGGTPSGTVPQLADGAHPTIEAM